MEYPYFTIYVIGEEEEKYIEQDIKEIMSIADEYLEDGFEFVVIRHVSKKEQIIITQFIINKCFDDYFAHNGDDFQFDCDGDVCDPRVPDWVKRHEFYDHYLSEVRDEDAFASISYGRTS
jgi:hypothetical protein